MTADLVCCCQVTAFICHAMVSAFNCIRFDCTSTKLFKFVFSVIVEVLFIYIAICIVVLYSLFRKLFICNTPY